MSWAGLWANDDFQQLFEDSVLTEYLNRIDRQLLDHNTPHDKTLALRGERVGILRVLTLVEELAERESVPLDDSETDAERDLRLLERGTGLRPMFRGRSVRRLVRTGGVA